MNDELKPEDQMEAQPEAPPVEEPVIPEHEAQMVAETFQAEQNLVMGSLAGIVAAVVGAGIWAGVTVLTEYQIGWVAIGIGLLVGFAFRFTGKGISQTFGIAAAVLSFAGCVLGNILTISYFVAVNQEMAFMDILTQLNYPIGVERVFVTPRRSQQEKNDQREARKCMSVYVEQRFNQSMTVSRDDQ